jgi:hypothetical protein
VAFLSALFVLALPATFGACGGNVYVDGPGGANSGTCGKGLTDCHGECVDIYSDPDNCGSCDGTCSAGYCNGGKCGVGPGCSNGLTDCGNGCVDTNSDPFNCGFCGNQCPDGAKCQGANGGCVISECWCGSICQLVSISSQVPQTLTGSIMSSPNEVTPVCAASKGPDKSFMFTAPFDANYTFDTFGSGFDTVLQVTDDSCGAIACNDDAGGNSASLVSMFLGGGQTVVITVDVLAGGDDFFQLNINAGDQPGECVTCAEAVTDNPNGFPVCEGVSSELYDSLVSCVCADECAFQCADNVCSGNDITSECQECVVDTVNGCGNQFNECSNDF